MSKEIRQQIAQQISKYRWMVFNIVDKSLPPFSYTVGLKESFNHAEIIISALEKEDAHAILNGIGNGIAEGMQREENVLYDDILDDRPCYFKAVLPEMYEEYLGRAVLYYENSDFPVLQCVWPDQDSQFPNDKGYDGVANTFGVYPPSKAVNRLYIRSLPRKFMLLTLVNRS